MASSILIVKLSSLGDVLHTLPAAQAIRDAFPGIRLGWAVEKAHAPLLDRQPWLDERVVWRRHDFRSFCRFVHNLRAGRWDVAIDFQGLLRSALVARLSGARRRIGFAPSKEWAHLLYTDRIPLETMDRHAVDRYLDLAGAVGAKFDTAHDDAPGQAGRRLFPLHPDADDRRAVDFWLAQRGFDPTRQRLVVLNPHCRKDANRWPAVRFAALAGRLLAEPNLRVALSGGSAARHVCDEIAAAAPKGIWRADGQFTLLRSAELFSRAAVMVTGDTGPMHMAVAVETPVVALFGPALPLRTGPYSPSAIVINRQLSCSPCFARRCPLGHNPPLCMDEITVDEVFAATRRQIELHGDRNALRRSA